MASSHYQIILIERKPFYIQALLPNPKTIAFSEAIAETAAWLRASSKIRTPDSIQLATAINAGASFFLTNDSHFPQSTQIQILELDKLVTRH